MKKSILALSLLIGGGIVVSRLFPGMCGRMMGWMVEHMPDE